jgi:hypothetical protein
MMKKRDFSIFWLLAYMVSDIEKSDAVACTGNNDIPAVPITSPAGP